MVSTRSRILGLFILLVTALMLASCGGNATFSPTVSGATADPYGSGVPNLLAYALQLNPAMAQPTNVPTPVNSNGHLTVTYFVPTSITDVSYVAEVSTDLITWKSGAGYTQVITNVAGAGGNTLTVQDMLPSTTQKRFMHLRVTQLP